MIESRRYTDAYGPNVEMILCQGSRVVEGPIPRHVRNQLMTAVKAGVLGRLPKDGLKPEIFFHPDHKNGARERQTREAAYAIKCIAGVMASPADVRAGIEAAGGDVLEYALKELPRVSDGSAEGGKTGTGLIEDDSAAAKPDAQAQPIPSREGRR